MSHAEPEHRFRSFKSDGLTLAYGDVGAGPPVVLIHGWGAAGSEWQEFGWVSLLAHRHRLLTPDVRGHGRSDKPHEPAAYRMDALARDVVGLLEDAGLPTAVLFGYSMGGAIALWTAALAPDRVERLVVGAPSGAEPEDAAALGRALRSGGPLEDRARSYRDYALRAPGNDLLALAACLETGLPAPACQDLARFHGAALLAAGERDRRYTATRKLASCLSKARFCSIPAADHMGAFGDHGFKRAVIDFLDEAL